MPSSSLPSTRSGAATGASRVKRHQLPRHVHQRIEGSDHPLVGHAGAELPGRLRPAHQRAHRLVQGLDGGGEVGLDVQRALPHEVLDPRPERDEGHDRAPQGRGGIGVGLGATRAGVGAGALQHVERVAGQGDQQRVPGRVELVQRGAADPGARATSASGADGSATSTSVTVSSRVGGDVRVRTILFAAVRQGSLPRASSTGRPVVRDA